MSLRFRLRAPIVFLLCFAWNGLAFGSISNKSLIVVSDTISKIQNKDFACAKWQNRLVAVRVDTINFEGKKSPSIVIVMDSLAPYVKKIFNELYNLRFPIRPFKYDKTYASKVVESYQCEENLPISRSISSPFKYGGAIGINNEENPSILTNLKLGKFIKIYPTTKNTIKHINRRVNRVDKPFRYGMVDTKVISIFRNNGFNIWGGDWDGYIDYHLFQIPNELADIMLYVSREDANKLFKYHVDYLQLPPKKNSVYLNHEHLYNQNEVTIKHDDLISSVLKAIEKDAVINMTMMGALKKLYQQNRNVFWQKIHESYNARVKSSESYQ